MEVSLTCSFKLTPTIFFTDADEKRVKWKQDRTIIPLAAGIYFLCYLDRSNIGNARILNSSTNNDMQTETHSTQSQFNVALMIFLIAYALFEVPSNILLKKLRPSRWLAFLMFSWGAITMGLGGVQNSAGMTGVRFLLGVVEAGLFPGLVYYLTFWYKSDERSIRVAMILASATLAGAFGGAIAYGIGHMNQAAGLSAWRWLFIIEGVPSCLSAIAVWFVLPDYPEEWLKGADRDIALYRLRVEGSKSHHASMTWHDAKATLVDWRLYGHYLIYFGISVPFSSLSLFTPSITSGLGYKDLEAQLMTVPPYAVAYGTSRCPQILFHSEPSVYANVSPYATVVQILVSWSADHFNSRALHSAALAFIGALGFLVSAVLPADDYRGRYACLIVASTGAFSCIPPMLGWLTSNVYSTAAVGLAVALNVSFGAGIGQIPGVWIYKAEEKETGYSTGHWTNAAMLLFVTAGCISMRFFYGYKNKKLTRESGGQEVRLYKL